MLKQIYYIIPKKFRVLSLRYLLLSLVNVSLDLLSIAYIIPLLIFILDESKIPDFINKLPFFDREHFSVWVIGGIAFFVFKNLVQTLIIKFQSAFVFDIATSLSSDLAKDFLQKPFDELQNADKGKELQKIQMTGTEFANNILLSIGFIFTELVTLSTLMVISFFVYPVLTLYVFLFGLGCILTLYILKQRRINRISSSLKKKYALASSSLLNILNGFLEIRSLRKERFFESKFKKSLKQFNANFVQLKTIQNSNIKYLEIFLIIGLSLFVLFIKKWNTSDIDRIVLTSYITGVSLKLFPSLNKIILSLTNIKSYSFTIEILKTLTIKKPKKNAPKTFNSELKLKNVSFGYNTSKRILDSINLTLLKGEFIGIKGESGVGKTTLLNVISGMLKPTVGEIYLDNLPIKYGSYLFNFVSYVPQHPFIFNGTILENITIGESKKTIDFERVNYFLKVFELVKFIENLPEKLETILSHDSLMLSGGQKQRIALIRALYNNPELLILDETTNQLDDHLESKIILFLKEYSKKNNITIILASHSKVLDISTKTYTLKNGKLNK